MVPGRYPLTPATQHVLPTFRMASEPSLNSLLSAIPLSLVANVLAMYISDGRRLPIKPNTVELAINANTTNGYGLSLIKPRSGGRGAWSAEHGCSAGRDHHIAALWQYRSISHNHRLGKGFRQRRRVAVFGSLFGPLGHLLFDDARVDAVAARLGAFSAEFPEKRFTPLPKGLLRAGVALRQAALQDVKTAGEGAKSRILRDGERVRGLK